MSTTTLESNLIAILESTIGKRSLPQRLEDHTPLLGAIPELDSMAVLGILTQIQDDFGVDIDDDEVNAELFETFGTLRRFVESKVG